MHKDGGFTSFVNIRHTSLVNRFQNTVCKLQGHFFKNSHCTITLNTILLPIALRFSPETDWKFKQNCQDFSHDISKFTSQQKNSSNGDGAYVVHKHWNWTELNWTHALRQKAAVWWTVRTDNSVTRCLKYAFCGTPAVVHSNRNLTKQSEK